MKQLILLIGFVICFSINGNAQLNINNKEVVGFYFYEAGIESISVKKFDKLVKKKNSTQ